MDSNPRGFPLPFKIALKLKGAFNILGLRKHEPLLPRILFMGADLGDTIRILKSIRSPEQWVENWRSLGMHYERIAWLALEDKQFPDASNAFRLAAVSYRIAEYMAVEFSLRAELWIKLIECFKESGKYCPFPLEEINLMVDDLRIPSWMRVPSTDGKVPCVITLGGVDGVKEEWYRVTKEYVERGWAAVALDLPGQGELRRLHGVLWKPDIERIISTIIDFLELDQRIDASRIAIVGGSTGGLFALRVAAVEPRIKACAVISAPVSLKKVYLNAPPPIPQTIEFNLGSPNKERTLKLLEKYSIESILQQIQCPVWQVYGGNDTTVSSDHGQLINAKVKNVCSIFYDDGDHICFNHLSEWEIIMRQWLSTQLDCRLGTQR